MNNTDNNTRYYGVAIKGHMTHDEALRELINSKNKTLAITRPEWLGLHYVESSGEYCILLRSGKIQLATAPESVWDTDKNDWMLVECTDEALKLMMNRR